MKTILSSASAALILLVASRAPAAEPAWTIHAEGAAARAVGSSGDTFGWGGAGLITPELALHPMVGVEGSVGAVGLAVRPDASPSFAHTSSGSALLTLAGVRIRPLLGRWGGLGEGLWIAGGAGLSATSGVLAPAVDARLGVDLRVGPIAIGPFGGLLQLINLHGGARPDDARIALFGVHGSFGLRRAKSRVAPPPPLAAPPDEAVVLAAPVVPEEPEEPEVPVAPVAPVAPRPAPSPELGDPIRFVFHRAEITEQGLRVVGAIAAFLVDHPEITRARVVGHADELGDAEYNLRLSERRAQAVVAALIRRGIDARRLDVAFHGKRKPRVHDPAERAREENRRVEIEVVEPKGFDVSLLRGGSSR